MLADLGQAVDEVGEGLLLWRCDGQFGHALAQARREGSGQVRRRGAVRPLGLVLGLGASTVRRRPAASATTAPRAAHLRQGGLAVAG